MTPDLPRAILDGGGWSGGRPMVAEVAEDVLVLNGVDALTGDYLTPPLAVASLAAELRAGLPPAGGEVRRRHQSDEAHLGVSYALGPRADDLSRAGWGVVLPEVSDPAVLEAVRPLLALRQEQAGERYRVLTAGPGEEKDDFLARYGKGPGVADPRRVPYYLLLLGSPEELPFELQYQLGVSYAVGRLDLPTPEHYARYVASVIADERRADQDDGGRPSSRPPSLGFFAPRHPGDRSTELSASGLVQPLADDVRDLSQGWAIDAEVGDGATSERLTALLTAAQAPDVLFAAGHGMAAGVASGANDRLAGALVCQGWPGPRVRRPVDPEHVVAADSLSAAAPIVPRLVMAFACFGAGTPRLSDYPGGPATLADRSFTAHLPQRLLGGGDGGALAFVGHVDRAWSCAFRWHGLTGQVAPFSSVLLALMDGARLGFAMESLTSRYAEVATELTHRLDAARKYGTRIGDADLVGLWTAAQDARGYVVLGDPAVRVVPRAG